MARATLAIQTCTGIDFPYKTDITFTNIVAADDMQVDLSSRDIILLISNGGTSGAQTATITHVDDEYGRGADVAIAVAQGKVAIVNSAKYPELFRQSDGYCYINATTEDVFGFAAIRIVK